MDLWEQDYILQQNICLWTLEWDYQTSFIYLFNVCLKEKNPPKPKNHSSSKELFCKSSSNF